MLKEPRGGQHLTHPHTRSSDFDPLPRWWHIGFPNTKSCCVGLPYPVSASLALKIRGILPLY